MYQKRTPGPTGTSCLTCKRRRKKCDRGRPVCERCITSGFECLGYGHNDNGYLDSSLADSPRDSVQQDYTGDYVPSYQLSSLDTPDDTHLAVRNDWATSSPFTPSTFKEQVSTSISATNITCPTATPHLDHIHDTNTHGSTFNHDYLIPVDSNNLLPTWQVHPSHETYSAVSSLASALEGSTTHLDNSFRIAPPSPHPWQLAQLHGRQYLHSIPRGLPPVSPNMANVIKYVLTQYKRLAAHSYFKLAHHQVAKMREAVLCRLHMSDATRWATYLGAKMYESLLEGAILEKTIEYDFWLRKYEQELYSTPTSALTNKQLQDRLSQALEIGFLKLRLNKNFYLPELLHSCAPTFFQIALSDPTLWPSESSFMAVSVSHIFGSNRYELGHYIHLDTCCMIVYAVPLTLQYDTSCSPFNTEIHPVEWIHGCPVEFHIAFIEINARCALGYVTPDWQDIERRIKSWQPRQYNPTGEACKDVTRLAVQESWRQLLLVYLYMALCGVASDDPRVQSAVTQIFQILGTVKRQDPPKIGIHFLIQYLVAGACTPSEKRRALVRFRMLDKFENNLWLLHGADFVPVLDHLWHGAAANGRPIRWSDYMASRQIALPVSV